MIRELPKAGGARIGPIWIMPTCMAAGKGTMALLPKPAVAGIGLRWRLARGVAAEMGMNGVAWPPLRPGTGPVGQWTTLTKDGDGPPVAGWESV